MKKLLLTIIAATSTLLTMAQAPAFPGAEGHGRYTTGGRGGTVYHVTNLDDSGEGSLRWALSKSGARTIVFDVAGDIHLNSNLVISNGKVTILGQTSPGGITVCDQTFQVKDGTSEVIVRFMRFRRGELGSVDDGADAAWGRNNSNIILDHCSFSWSTDEVASWYDNKNFTMQWCVCAEGLASGHTKGSHSYGGIWGGKNASFHHTMIAHVDNRAPRFNGARYNWQGYDKDKYANTIQAERVDFRNCVMYNWGNGNGCYGGPGGGYINMVNNYYKAGPATKNKTRVTQVSFSDAGNGGDNPFPNYASRYYINGNYVTAAPTPANYDWQGVIYDAGVVMNGYVYMVDEKHYYGDDVEYVKNSSNQDCVRIRLDEPIEAGEVTTHTAEVAFEKMLAYGGACLYRDGHDTRYMEEARTGTVTYYGSLNGWPGILDKCIDTCKDGSDYPWLSPEAKNPPLDSDKDGIPDEWEIANGLDPNDPSDGNKYTIDPKGWYTNLEVYANSLVEKIMKACQADGVSSFEEYYPTFTASVNAVKNNASATKVEYFTLDGQKVSTPVKGINIRRITYSNGTVETDKVLMK